MDIHGYPWILVLDISMDIHGYPHINGLDMDMDMDAIFHIHGKPAISHSTVKALIKAPF